MQRGRGRGDGLADLQEKINTASCGEEQTGDCPGPRKEATDGLYVTQGDHPRATWASVHTEGQKALLCQ